MRFGVQNPDLGPVVLLFERPGGDVGVAGADQAELVRVRETAVGEPESPDQCVADVAAFRLADDRRRDLVRHDLEVGPLVVGRQGRMGVRGALDLGHLDDRFVAHPDIDVLVVERIAIELLHLEHAASGAVRVVRDGERVDALVPPLVHRGPEVLGVLGVDPAERCVGGFGTAEDDVAVQVVPLVAGRRVLVGDEGREVPRIVVGLGRLDDLGPGAPDDVHVQMLVFALPGAKVGPHADEDAAAIVGLFGHAHVGGDRVVIGRRALFGHRREHAEVHAVVGHALEVERPVELHVEAGGMLDRPALGELVGVVRVGRRAEDEGIEGVAGVDVKVAEVGVLRRVRTFRDVRRRRVAVNSVLAGRAGNEQEGGKGGQRRDHRELLHRFSSQAVSRQSTIRSTIVVWIIAPGPRREPDL